MVYSKQRMRLERISASYLAARKSIVAMFGGVRRTNSREAASLFIFGSSTYLDDVTPKN